MEEFAWVTLHASGVFFITHTAWCVFLLHAALFFFCLALLCSLLYINSMRLLSAWSTYTVKHREQSFYLNMQPPTDGSDFTIGPQQTDTYNFVVFFYHTCGLVCFFVGPALRCFFFLLGVALFTSLYKHYEVAISLEHIYGETP
jgi:hypothetical protein